MSCDEFWPGGPRFLQAGGAFPIGTDAVLLAHFASPPRTGRMLDLGSGSGVISVLLALQQPGLQADGLELQPQAVETARRNAALNRLEERVRFVQGDLREVRIPERAGAYELVVSNPPYFPVGSGKAAAGEETAIAREERCCSLADVCAAAAYYTKWGGRFALVHRPERLAEIFVRMASSGLQPKRLRMVQPTAAAAPSLVLVEGRRGGRPGLSVEPPLILREADGRDTQEVKEIYHRREE